MKNEVRQVEKAGISDKVDKRETKTGGGATTSRVLTESKNRERYAVDSRDIRAPNRVTEGIVPGVLCRGHTACTYVGKAEQAHLIPNEFDDGRYPGACG